MKHLIPIILCIILAVGFGRCTKTTQDSNGGYLRKCTQNSKSAAYQMFVRIGHSGRNCPGCVRRKDGSYVHIDCQGYGNQCTAYSQIYIIETGTSIFATTIDTLGLTSENFFAMPDRSLEYFDENNDKIYLNIPAQTVYRDTVTLQFTFTGLYFSSTAAYSNN